VVRYLCTSSLLPSSCIRRSIVSRACDWVTSRLSDMLLIFQFPIQSSFLPCLSARQHSGVLVYPISDIGRCRKFGSVPFCTERTSQPGNEFKLIVTVKMETRHPVEEFSSKFRAICNRCVVMAAWSGKTLKFCETFLRFLKKRPLTVKFSKIMFRKLASPHRSTLLCSNFVNFGRREIGEIVRYLVDIKFRLSQTVATARIAPTICQGQPPTMYSECSRFNPNRFTFGGVIAERVNTAKSPRRLRYI